MKKISNIHPNYTIGRKEYQLVLPLDYEELIPGDDSVRLLSQVMEELDYRELKQAYAHVGRTPGIDPVTMFKLVVYGTMNQIYSSRKLEKACRRDINFRWLLGGRKAPDHNTINRFKSKKLGPCLEGLFYQLVKKLGEDGEISYENIFIDGTKLEASASRYTFVWRKAVEKQEEKLRETLRKTYGTDLDLKELKKKCTDFKREMESQEIPWVQGKGHHKTSIQRELEQLNAFIERKEKYQQYHQTFEDRNSFSKTDTDATFMRMKEDHMRNGQLKPGYNIQVGVEGEYIVGMDIFNLCTDTPTLVPFMENLAHNLPNTFKRIVADGGYESEENYVYLKKKGYEAYIKPSNHEMKKKRTFKKAPGRIENMRYDEEQDCYFCQKGKALKWIGERNKKSKTGYVAKISIYGYDGCKRCVLKESCTRGKDYKRLYLSKVFKKHRAQSEKNIKSSEGIVLRMNRSIQAEGIFGILKEDYGFRRFLGKGMSHVKMEYLLLCFGHNIIKLHHKIQRRESGVILHQRRIA